MEIAPRENSEKKQSFNISLERYQIFCYRRGLLQHFINNLQMCAKEIKLTLQTPYKIHEIYFRSTFYKLQFPKVANGPTNVNNNSEFHMK